MKLWLLFLLIPVLAIAGRLQNEDFKTESELVTAGGTKTQLLNDTKIYVTSDGINKTLDDAITDGDIGGGSPTTTQSDIIVRGASEDERLGVGLEGQVLSIVSGFVQWADAVLGTTLSVKGDLQTFTTENESLGVGTDGTFLVADSNEVTGLKWSNQLQGVLNPVSDSGIACEGTTTHSFGTGVSVSCSYSRSGDRATINLKALVTGAIGSPSNVSAFTLPSSLTIDWSKLNPEALPALSRGGGYAIETGVQSFRISAELPYNTQTINTRLSNLIPSVGSTDYVGAKRTGSFTGTNLFTFATNDFIELEFEVPIVGWSSGTDAVVQNKTLTQVSGRGNAGITVVASSTNIPFTQVIDNNSTWSGDIFTPTETGRYIVTGGVQFSTAFNFDMGLYNITDSAYHKFLGTNDEPTRTYGHFGDTVDLIAGKQYAIRTTVGGTLVNNVSIHTLSITQQPVNLVIVGTFGNCQTKFLSANIGSDTTDITNLRFNNLTIGNEYSVYLNPRFRFEVTDNTDFLARSNALEVCGIRMGNSGGGLNDQRTKTCRFVAAATTLTVDATGIAATNSYIGNGAVTNDSVTNVTVCTDNRAETTGF
jgi:hypothetical protein